MQVFLYWKSVETEQLNTLRAIVYISLQLRLRNELRFVFISHPMFENVFFPFAFCEQVHLNREKIRGNRDSSKVPTICYQTKIDLSVTSTQFMTLECILTLF